MKTDQMYQLLFEAVQTGTVSAVREAASRIFESAVSVTDVSFRVLSADEDPGSTDDMLERSGELTYVSSELLDLFREHSLISSLTERPHETIVVDWGYFADHPHLTTGIFWEDHILGSVAVLVDSPKFSAEEDRALQATADALALVLHEGDYGKRKLSVERDHFISKLFNGSLGEKELNIAEDRRFFKKQKRYVMLATEFTPDAIYERIGEGHPRILLYQDGGITYLMGNPDSLELRDVEDWIAARGHRYGVSYSFTDPLLAHRMAVQAAAALIYGNRYGQKKADWDFPGHALDMLVQAVPDATGFLHPGLTEIAKYDQENNTQYMETLRIWLEHAMDYSETAKAMNLHRNSLYYRMRRIEELFDIDLGDMNTAVQLYIGLRIQP